MKRVFYYVIAIAVSALIVGCGAMRNSKDHRPDMSGSMKPIDLGEKYPSIPLQQVPQTQDLIKGVLDNGLTYYILRGDNVSETAFQPGKACFRLVQNTGSLMEDDHKTGVAHFVEHYAFDGTEHFPDNAAIEFMRGIGINFGNDANATTSWDYTEYNLDNVPVATNKSNIDSCLLLLRDWACALTFDPKHIERERSVILEEYRLRAPMIVQKQCKAFLDDTRYGNRMSIGTADDIKTVTIDDLKDYYNKWYQPQNQAVVVFGDINVKQIETKIKEMFGSIPRGSSQVPRYQYTPISHSKPKAYVIADKAADRAYLGICFSVAADSLVRHRNTSAWYINYWMRCDIIRLLTKRLERIQKETMLIDGVSFANNQNFVCIKDDYPVILWFSAPKDNWRKALEIVAAEVEKVKKYGWTAFECSGEFHKGIAGLPSVNIADSINFDKDESLPTNIGYLSANLLTFDFVYGEPVFDRKISGVMDHRRLYGVSPAMAHDYYCGVVADSNTTILLTLPKGTALPTDADVVDTYLKVRDTDLEPSKYQYAEDKNIFDLLDSLPTDFVPWQVLSSKKSELKGCTELTLSNGVKVIISDVGASIGVFDIVVLRFGELDYYTDDEVKKIKLLPRLVANKFADRGSNSVNLSSSVLISSDNYDEFKYGSWASLSAESVFKYIRYTLTDTSIDSLRFDAYKQNLISNADADENPLGYLGYLWSKAVYGDVFDKRQDNLTKPQLEQLTLNELQELYKSYISNYDGSVILIRTGNSVGEIQPLIEKYLGSLPSLKSDARQRKFGGFNVAHSNDSLSIKSPMQMPRTDFLMGYVLDSNAPYSQERDIQHEAFTKFFSELLYDKIRLDDGNVYALSSEYYIPYYCWREEFVRVYAVCAPSYAATLQQKIDHIIRQMAYGDLITPQMLNDYINGRISKLPREIEDKDYFNYFCNYYKNQCTDRRITDEKLLRALTVDDVKALAREYLEKGFKKQVVVSTDVID